MSSDGKPGEINYRLWADLNVLLGLYGPPEPLLEELWATLKRIVEGQEPNEAFGWHRKRGPDRDSKKEWEALHIGCRVIYLNRERGIPINDRSDKRGAISQVAEETENTETKVRKCYKRAYKFFCKDHPLYGVIKNHVEKLGLYS